MPTLDFDQAKSEFRTYFDEHASLFEDACSSFIALLTALVSHSGKIQVAKIDGRVKDREECIRKFSRKYRAGFEEGGAAYDIAPHITDLIGLRIVCLYEDEISQAADVVKSHFQVIEVTDKVSAVESTEGSFGYKGLHMDLKLNDVRTPLPEYTTYAPLRFELQIRTIVQDSWSVLDHKIKYKKSIPVDLKRRINVLSALFELADREFRQIRDETEAALREAPDETEAPQLLSEAAEQGQEAINARQLNAFTFLKIAKHFFWNYDFEPHKVDGFVHDIVEWSPEMTRSLFNRYMKENLAKVKKYKQYFEDKNPADKLNPFTIIRHCLYLADPGAFSRALTAVARDGFDQWLCDNPNP